MTAAEKVLQWIRHHNRVVGNPGNYQIIAQLEMAIKEEKTTKEQSKWISVEDKPLFTKDENDWWTTTKEGDNDFIAAIELSDGKWWMKHCVIEDEIGLCVVGETENEPAPWGMEQVEYWQEVPEPPTKNKQDNG